MKSKLENKPEMPTGGREIRISHEEQLAVFEKEYDRRLKEYALAEEKLEAEARVLDPETKKKIIPQVEENNRRAQEIQDRVREQIAA